MKLVNFRAILDPEVTHGMLSVDGEWFCNVLEDTDRRLETHPENKVYGKTAIPRGLYEVRISFSKRFQKPMLEVVGVPTHTGVRIHGGRDADDTEGCPLVGRLVGERLVDGPATSARLFKLVEAAIARGEAVTLEVR